MNKIFNFIFLTNQFQNTKIQNKIFLEQILDFIMAFHLVK